MRMGGGEEQAGMMVGVIGGDRRVLVVIRRHFLRRRAYIHLLAYGLGMQGDKYSNINAIPWVGRLTWQRTPVKIWAHVFLAEVTGRDREPEPLDTD